MYLCTHYTVNTLHTCETSFFSWASSLSYSQYWHRIHIRTQNAHICCDYHFIIRTQSPVIYSLDWLEAARKKSIRRNTLYSHMHSRGECVCACLPCHLCITCCWSHAKTAFRYTLPKKAERNKSQLQKYKYIIRVIIFRSHVMSLTQLVQGDQNRLANVTWNIMGNLVVEHTAEPKRKC